MSENKESVIIKREQIWLMKIAVSYASRGMGFALACVGVIVQGMHMYLAFSLVNPFTNPYVSFVVSFLGAIFLSGALLYYVGRASVENIEAQNAVNLFTWLEVGLGMIFYLDKLIYKPFMAGIPLSQLQYPSIIMGCLLAVFIPIAIKGYANQVRSLDPVLGEKHDLSKSDMLQITGDIEMLINRKLAEYKNDYESVKKEVGVMYGVIDSMSNYVLITMGDLMDKIDSRLDDVYNKLSDQTVTMTDALFTAQEALDIVQSSSLAAHEYDAIPMKLIDGIDAILFEFEMKWENTMLGNMDSKIKEMSSVFKEQGTAQQKILHEHTKRMSAHLETKAKSIITLVQEQATAQATEDLGLYADDMVAKLVDKEGIIKDVIHQIQTQNLDNHQIATIKKTLGVMKDTMNTHDDSIKKIEKTAIKMGDRHKVMFYLKEGKRNHVMTIGNKENEGTNGEGSVVVE